MRLSAAVVLAQLFVSLAIANELPKGGPVFVNSSSGLHAAACRNGTDSPTIHLTSSFALDPSMWNSNKTCVVTKTLMIRPADALSQQRVVLDLANVGRGAMRCTDPGCTIQLSGGHYNNLWLVNHGTLFGGMVVIPSPLSMGEPNVANGNFYGSSYTVVLHNRSDDFMLDPDSVFWTAIGQLRALGAAPTVECRQEKELIIRDWTLSAANRAKFFYQDPRGANGTGVWTFTDVHIRLSDDYPWTKTDCRQQVKVCRIGGSPLPNPSCPTSNNVALGVGLGVGLGVVMLLAVGGGIGILLRHHRRAKDQDAATSGKGSAMLTLYEEPGLPLADCCPTPNPNKGLLSTGSRPFSNSGDANSSMEGTKQVQLVSQVENLKQQMLQSNGALAKMGDLELQVLELLGEGTFGRVHKALWRGTTVAVKTMHLPANMSGAEKRERMAIMEAAISTSLNHPAIVHTYTYSIKPTYEAGTSTATFSSGNTLVVSPQERTTSKGADFIEMEERRQQNVHSYEVRLVLEYCDRGCLRAALDTGAFQLADGAVNYAAVLDTGIDIATAMVHMHDANVLHSDLKVQNVMLKTSGDNSRGVVAKVADFGLAMRLDHEETHRSGLFQGTLTHMAPEVMLSGRVSKASDVFAFGILLWELYTGRHAFKGVPKALLGHTITNGGRPQFLPNTPKQYAFLVARCWDTTPEARPTFREVLAELTLMREQLYGETLPLRPGSSPLSPSTSPWIPLLADPHPPTGYSDPESSTMMEHAFAAAGHAPPAARPVQSGWQLPCPPAPPPLASPAPPETPFGNG